MNGPSVFSPKFRDSIQEGDVVKTEYRKVLYG